MKNKYYGRWPVIPHRVVVLQCDTYQSSKEETDKHTHKALLIKMNTTPYLRYITVSCSTDMGLKINDKTTNYELPHLSRSTSEVRTESTLVSH